MPTRNIRRAISVVDEVEEIFYITPPGECPLFIVWRKTPK